MRLISPVALLLVAAPAFALDSGPLLMREPTVNATDIVFSFSGDLWRVPRSGGVAVRLTSSTGTESHPFFSPDGKWIAFTGQYDGNADVYVMPSEGGSPKRLTAHPSPDVVSGWTPDGKSVVYTSTMYSNTDYTRMFTVPVGGGFPTQLPFPAGQMGAISPDGKQIAYVPNIKWEEAWKRYRGGQAYPIWLGRLSDSKVTKLPRKTENIYNPAWFGDKIYYLSDAKGPVGLMSYDPASGRTQEEVKGEGFDLKAVSAGPDVIVYEKLGGIYLYDPAKKESTKVDIDVRGDFPEMRPQFKNLAPYISDVSISPTGQRLVVSARGYIFTVPASKGDWRIVNEAQGLHRREGSWSPDGKTIAYITDPQITEELELYDVQTEQTRKLKLGGFTSTFSNLSWSPDSKRIAYLDYNKNMWVTEVESGKTVKIDHTTYNDPQYTTNLTWSPDSAWITYARDLDNHLHAVFLYEVATGKVTQVTDGMADAFEPAFDRSGKYIFFAASTQVGQAASWLDLTSLNQPNIPASLYMVVLDKDGGDPLAPESDEEPVKEAPKEGGEKPAAAPQGAPPKARTSTIDLEGIQDRIVALPGTLTGVSRIVSGPAGTFFVLVPAKRATGISFDGAPTLLKYTMHDRKLAPFAQGVQQVKVSADGNKLVLLAGGVSIVPAAAPAAAPGQGAVNLDGLTAKIDPKVEWEHMVHEAWYHEKVQLYDPGVHGIDTEAMAKKYSAFVPNLTSREDLNYLFVDMMGEVSVGHMFPGGGDSPAGPAPVPGGLLGADYTFDNGHYKIARVYTGENWNGTLRGPLAKVGVDAKAGEYILAIDGKELTQATDIYVALENKAGKQVQVKIGPNVDGTGSRTVTVVPTASETGLRQWAWREDNRRYVLEKTGGRAGYVHIPDTQAGAWSQFTRFFYAQTDKDGMVVDERFNHGGLIANFLVDVLGQKLDAAYYPRAGKPWPSPGGAIFGPKVLLANEMSGSGGDMFPWLFRHRKIGPIIGKRTWGGLIAAFGFQLADGGQVNAPDCSFFNPHTGKWMVEGWGVDPDIDVDLDPYLWRQGRDSQLDRAIEEINKALRDYKPIPLTKPAYRDKSKVSDDGQGKAREGGE
ncbi:MAG: PD40 domain-containing protein [Fimbriimonadaceae bacterium]|nr:PD40 domain-containing protein [Fimbriimonadaceae bacterium]